MRVLLYMALAWSIFELCVQFAEAGKPREPVPPAAAVIGGLVVTMYAVPLVWLLASDQPESVMTLAFTLLVLLAVGVANLVRQTAGVRGEKTPLGTFALCLAGVYEIGALVAILSLT